ncbi:MAG TPA: dihydrodipicolinate synthase family protein [Pyrinomonadaceae bacterium]
MRGILLPFTTPFSASGDLDVPRLRANIRLWNKSGISGYVAVGSTGERAHLDEREYLQVIEAARSEVSSESRFIVGAGQHSTRKTIAEIKAAEMAGADAVLVLTPHYYRPAITQDVLLDHYRAVADASPVPVILYSMPALTGIKIAPDTVARLSEHENIIGIKDSSNDLPELKTTVQLCGDDFAVITGNGTVLFDALSVGARAAILAVGCVVPELCLDILKAFEKNDHERARGLQEALTPLAAAVTTKYGIGGLKAALDLAGYHGGFVRAPLRMPDARAREEIALLLNEAQAALSSAGVSPAASAQRE